MWSAGSTAGVIATGGDAAPGQGRFALAIGTQDEWRLEGDGVDAVVSGVRGWVQAGDLRSQACLVSGALGGEQVQLPGVRALRPQPERVHSLRQVLAWFGAERAVALDAARHEGSRGHERDRVSAAILRADLEAAVQDARLSTTYDAAGLALRVGLELWLADEQEHPFAHRLAGEACQPGQSASAHSFVVVEQGLTLDMSPLLTHYAGAHGSGVMILARAT